MMTKLRVLPVRLGRTWLLLAAIAALGTVRLGAVPVAPVMNPPQVVGNNLTLSWTTVAATSYRLGISLSRGGPVVFSQIVGNTDRVSVGAPDGIFFVRVFASDATGEGPASEDVEVRVGRYQLPAAPTDLAAYINNQSALITWNPGVGGGTPSAFVLSAILGGQELGPFPLSAGSNQVGIPFVPAGAYTLRLSAVNQGGASAPSNEVVLDMPAGGGCSAPPARTLSPTVFGRYVRVSWAPVPGVAAYRLDFATSPGGAPIASLGYGGGSTSFSTYGVGNGVYYGRLTTAFSCGQQSTGAETMITVDGAPPPGPRAPDPAPGQRLPFRGQDGAIVEQLARERPDLLNASCREHGGNNRFMFEAVRRLRAVDNRYGLNWKRGNVGDLSQDIVTYNPTDQPDEGNRSPYIIDIIGGHCGPRPSAAWIDQTAATRNAGTIGIWTLIPYLDAGYPIVSDPEPRQ